MTITSAGVYVDTGPANTATVHPVPYDPVGWSVIRPLRSPAGHLCLNPIWTVVTILWVVVCVATSLHSVEFRFSELSGNRMYDPSAVIRLCIATSVRLLTTLTGCCVRGTCHLSVSMTYN